MFHFPTSQPSTAFYLKLGCILFSLQKLQMLTPVHNNADDTNDADNADDANDADDTDNADNYNRVIGIALMKAFSCAKNQIPYMLKTTASLRLRSQVTQ